MTTETNTNRWRGWLPLLMAVWLASPVFEQVEEATEPSLGRWPAFIVAALTAGVVALPFLFVMNWIVQRELDGRTNDLPAMIYRPAILPVWAFAGAAIENVHEFRTEWTPWLAHGWLFILLAAATIFQYRRGRAWSWWVAVPISVALALVAVGATVFVVSLIAPEELRQ